MVKPLQNIRVLDLTQVLAGPFCTGYLASMGAEDIRIEPPWGAYGSALFESLPLDVRRRSGGNTQRNKKNITLNLNSAKGKEIFIELVKKSDVVVENFAPGIMDKFGLGYPALKKANPRIIYCSIKGYGENGPWKDRVAYDVCVQAASGFLSTIGYPDRPPVKPGPSVSDCICGIYGALGIMTALHARDTLTGEGQMIDCAMYDSITSIMGDIAAHNLTSGQPFQRNGNHAHSTAPCGAYPTSDGKLEFIQIQTNAQWEAFLKLTGRDDILGEKWNLAQRVERAGQIDEMTEEWTRTKTQQEIDTILSGLNIPCAPVLDINEVFKHPQAAAREMFLETTDMFGTIDGVMGIVPKLSDTPGVVEWGLMPRGAFNSEIYMGILGYSEEQLTQLKNEGVI